MFLRKKQKWLAAIPSNIMPMVARARWSKGKIVAGKAEGYWEWYRLDGTLKRSGFFKHGEPVGEWTTYDAEGKVYKVSHKK